MLWEGRGAGRSATPLEDSGRATQKHALFAANGVAVDGAEEAATAFEEADDCGPRPNDLGFNREAADLGMVERDDGSLVGDRVIV